MYPTNPVNIHQVARNMQQEKLQEARRRYLETAVHPNKARRSIFTSFTRPQMQREFARVGRSLANISLLNFML